MIVPSWSLPCNMVKHIYLMENELWICDDLTNATYIWLETRGMHWCLTQAYGSSSFLLGSRSLGAPLRVMPLNLSLGSMTSNIYLNRLSILNEMHSNNFNHLCRISNRKTVYLYQHRTFHQHLISTRALD